MVPADVTRAVLDEESPGLLAWARRKQWDLLVDAARLVVVSWFPHPRDGGLLVLEGDLEGYKAVPPAWRFLDIENGTESRRAFPLGTDSFFHSDRVICAPWNRLAYKDHGGPHGNWGGPSQWLDVRDGTQAHTLADMLAVLHGRVHLSPGRLA